MGVALEWMIADFWVKWSAKAQVFDTTAVNTGHIQGVCQSLNNLITVRGEMYSLNVLEILYIKDSKQTGIIIYLIQNLQNADWNGLNSHKTEDPNLFAK